MGSVLEKLTNLHKYAPQCCLKHAKHIRGGVAQS